MIEEMKNVSRDRGYSITDKDQLADRANEWSYKKFLTAMAIKQMPKHLFCKPMSHNRSRKELNRIRRKLAKRSRRINRETR